MLLADTQQRKLLQRLHDAGDKPAALIEQRRGGIDSPATIVSDFEPNGCAIERVYDRGRLVGIRRVEPEARDAAAARASSTALGTPIATSVSSRTRRNP